MTRSLIALAAAASLATSTQAGAASIDVDLGTMPIGQPPAGFELARTGKGAPAQWTVVADPASPAGRVIAQTGADPTDYRFPLAIVPGFSAKDVEVTLRFKPVAGKVDRAGGIAIRLRDAGNYYVVRANALEDNVRFYRVVKGDRRQIAGANVKVAADEWHRLGLRAEGDRFTISYDGKELYTATDRTFGDPGKVALWTKADSVTHFDTIRIAGVP